MAEQITKPLMPFDDVEGIVMDALHSPDAEILTENLTTSNGQMVARMIALASCRGDAFDKRGKVDPMDCPSIKNLERDCPLDNGKICHGGSPFTDLGTLDKIPDEVLLNILKFVDIPSLARFRGVNYRAMAMVDSVPQYATILKHCPDVFRAAISIEASFFSCAELFDTLRTDKCSDCGKFGAYVYLIDCRRVCQSCSSRCLDYCPLTTMRAAKYITITPDQERQGLTKRDIILQSSLPRILGLPSTYQTAAVEPGDLVAPAEVSQRIPFFDRKAVMQGHSSPGYWHAGIRPKSLSLILVQAPKIFERGLGIDWGVACLGCAYGYASNQSFTRARLVDHLREKGPVLLDDDSVRDISDVHVRRAVTGRHLSDLRQWEDHNEVLSCLQDRLVDLMYHEG